MHTRDHRQMANSTQVTSLGLRIYLWCLRQNIIEAFLGGGSWFFCKRVGETVQYNNTRDVNERATCIIDQLFP